MRVTITPTTYGFEVREATGKRHSTARYFYVEDKECRRKVFNGDKQLTLFVLDVKDLAFVVENNKRVLVLPKQILNKLVEREFVFCKDDNTIYGQSLSFYDANNNKICCSAIKRVVPIKPDTREERTMAFVCSGGNWIGW